MWTRFDLKLRAKTSIQKNYWSCVLVALVVSATVAVGITGIIAIVLQIFVASVLAVGGAGFFLRNQTEQPGAGTLFDGFRSGSYLNIVGTMFLKDLFILLWALLFFIPGIIKFYEYRMIPYVLAENPGMHYKDAFSISKRMMYGQKWNTFVLDLSFIGWRILEAFTFGILGIFYVEPYYQATFAELYAWNRTMAYQNGYIR